MSEQTKFWGARLSEGVRPKHLFTFYLAAFFTIMLAVGINTLQPYLLTTFLNLHITQHGDASGSVGTVSEIVLVVLVALWGILSERAGRRIIYVLGFWVMGLGFGLTPLSDSLGILIGARAVYAVGIAATSAMLATIVADYVVNDDRGKANAIMGVMNGLGAATGALALSKLPRLFQGTGQDPIEAGWSTYLTLAGGCVAIGLLMQAGLKPGRAVSEGEGEHSVPMGKMAREGLVAARRDIGVSLSYAAAFVARADLAVAGLFFPLWLTKHQYALVPEGMRVLVDRTRCAAEAIAADPAVAEACRTAGEASADGVEAGGTVVAAIGGAGLLFAPVIGILCDRINRVQALVIGLGLNVIGYGLTYLVTDPTSGMIWVAAAVIGFGQVGGVISSQVLIQQQAPAGARGSVIGTFGAFGALGIMFSLFVGGKLFDQWREAGPFVMLSGLNLLVVIAALAVKRRVRAPDAGSAARGVVGSQRTALPAE